MKIYGLFLLSLFLSFCAYGQQTKWDDTQEAHWPEAFEVVEIPSTLDGNLQKAYFYASKSRQKKPLIVSLHTWSGDYQQKDPLAKQSLERDWNYIHPDFRGPNNTPQACGSKFAIQDIDEAIGYAIEHANVDTSQIHVIGASGGGYATLLSFMETKHPVKIFSAWVPISNLVDWYYESVGRGQRYADDILAATESGESLNIEEAQKRSPYFMETPHKKRRDSKLYIYAGIHDGYLGSVPITQSIRFYNKVVAEREGYQASDLVSAQKALELVVRRTSVRAPFGQIGDRKIHLKKQSGNIQLIIFEGKHEMLSDIALDLLK